MAKNSRFLVFLIFLLLMGCNRPDPQTGQLPPDTEVSLPSVTDTLVPDQSGETEQPSNTVQPTETQLEPTAEPVPPTKEPEDIILAGDPIPLLPAGSFIDIREVQMIDENAGWAITADAEGIFHILKTSNTGHSWWDITPPQPINPDLTWFPAAVEFSDPNNGWVSYSDTDLIWRTKDGGKTWDPSRLEFVGRSGSMIHSLDNNRVWFFQFLEGGMQKVYTAVYSSSDGGATWIKLLDPTTDTDSSIQGFDKTGVDFINPQYGWLTRNFRGVAIYVKLDITTDGGATWQSIDMPAPPSAPEAFSNCVCGLSNPDLISTEVGSVKLECMCNEGGSIFTKNYLYRTSDGGSSWDIEYIPEGELHHIGDEDFFVINREIYRTEFSGDDWSVVNTVNWDGQFSFIDGWHAIGVAYDPDDDQYALVETRDGCKTFAIISTRIINSDTIR